MEINVSRFFLLCFLFALLGESTIIGYEEENTSKINYSRSSDINQTWNLYEDDTYIGEEEEELMRSNMTGYRNNAVKDPKYLWPGGKVYYNISSGFDQQKLTLIRNAMKHIQTETCVQFIDIKTEKPPHGHSILIVNEKPAICISYYVGFQIDKKPHQLVNLADFCFTTFSVERYLLKVLGLYDEHKRPDRGYFITILWENIAKGEKNRFKVNKASTTFGLPYDYRSVMQLPRHYFSKEKGKPTMQAKWNPIMCLGNNVRATQCDLEKVRKLYNCPLRNNCAPKIQLPDAKGKCPLGNDV